MTTLQGQNKKGLKLQNQSLALRLVATHPGISRVDIAKKTGLTKMTAGNLVSEMIDAGLVEEYADTHAANGGGVGRNPRALRIADRSPCIIGVSIKRGLYQLVLSDLAGNFIDHIVTKDDEPIDAKRLVSIVKSGIDRLRKGCRRSIIGVGIACVGPVNSTTGIIVSPANFFGIRDVPIVDIIRKHTGLPTFLINDGNAGALAEKTFGDGRDASNFFYLHIMYGIGAGFVFENMLYDGVSGQSGEIGHTTINFAGPKCNCGNTGCLELYANIDNIRRHIHTLSSFHPTSAIARRPMPTLPEVIDAANSGDALAVAALDRFCDYLSHALANIIMLLDVCLVIADFQSTVPGTALETLLSAKMSFSVYKEQYSNLRIVRSRYNGKAPLMGAVALVANKVFENEITLSKAK